MTFTHGNSYMWLFDHGEYEPEKTVSHSHHYVSVMKVGGGLVGRRYDGSWLYRVMDTRNGQELSRGQIDSDISVTHDEVATVVNASYLASRETPATVTTLHNDGIYRS